MNDNIRIAIELPVCSYPLDTIFDLLAELRENHLAG